jgi:hypothetical protein
MSFDCRDGHSITTIGFVPRGIRLNMPGKSSSPSRVQAGVGTSLGADAGVGRERGDVDVTFDHELPEPRGVNVVN